MRLIDADAFLERCAHMPMIQDAMKKAFDQMPTIEIEPERLEIIHCRDCIHNANLPESGNALCVLFYGMTDQYGYCHKGERRSYAAD